MRKPPTGEPCAGEPHARFGGRGERKFFPTPIKHFSLRCADLSGDRFTRFGPARKQRYLITFFGKGAGER
jgi:hypothetical protein